MPPFGGVTRRTALQFPPAGRGCMGTRPKYARGCQMTVDPQQFASDNYAGICPEAWTAIERANHDPGPAYGEDQWTQAAADAFRELFEKADAEVFFAFNGT